MPNLLCFVAPKRNDSALWLGLLGLTVGSSALSNLIFILFWFKAIVSIVYFSFPTLFVLLIVDEAFVIFASSYLANLLLNQELD